MPADDASIGEIKADDLILIEPRAGKARERPGVDVGLVELIVTCDQARQHARIWAMHFAGDESETRPGQPSHPEHSQHGDVSVPGTDQDHVFENGMHFTARRYETRRSRRCARA